MNLPLGLRQKKQVVSQVPFFRCETVFVRKSILILQKTTCSLSEAVINPGNPTGTVLTRDVIEAVVRWVVGKDAMGGNDVMGNS